MSEQTNQAGGTIGVGASGAIGTITIDHAARRNAMTSEMWRTLPEAFAQLAHDAAVRVIILRGSGEEAFVSGADISEFAQKRTPEKAREYELFNERAFDAVRVCPKPVIAMIHGFCMGGGVGLAIGADLRIAADDAVFGVPAAKLGLGYPPRSLATLLSLVGPSYVKELFFTALRIPASRALAMGLLNDVVPKAELEAHVMRLALTIAENAPLTIAAIKLTLAQLTGSAADQDPQAIADAVQRCFDSEDYREGVRAFLEKRRPRFQGY